LKVLLINSVCGYGSTGRIAADLYDMLVEKGDEAAVAFGRKDGKSDIESYRIGSMPSTLFHLFMTRFFDMHGLWSRRATKGLIAYIDSFKPDIIHLHNLHGYYLNLELLFEYIAKKKIKVVWTLHDCWSVTGHCSHFEYVACDKWISQCEECPQKKEYPASLVFDRSKKNYSLKKKLFNLPKNMVLITPSDWLKAIIKKSYLSKYRVETIHTGIDLNVFKPSSSNMRKTLGISEKKILLGVASPFSERKGFNDFISLSKMLPDDYIIILAGLKHKQIISLPKNVLGLGRLHGAEEIAKLYSMADVFINPTKEDTFPTTILESLACGTPVITYDVGGCVEAIDKTCGIAVKKDDIDGIVTALEKIEAKPLSQENCIERAKTFEKTNQLEKIYRVYN